MLRERSEAVVGVLIVDRSALKILAHNQHHLFTYESFLEVWR